MCQHACNCHEQSGFNCHGICKLYRVQYDPFKTKCTFPVKFQKLTSQFFQNSNVNFFFENLVVTTKASNINFEDQILTKIKPERLIQMKWIQIKYKKETNSDFSTTWITILQFTQKNQQTPISRAKSHKKLNRSFISAPLFPKSKI